MRQVYVTPMTPSFREGLFEAEPYCPEDTKHRHVVWIAYEAKGVPVPPPKDTKLPARLREKWDYPWLMTMM